MDTEYISKLLYHLIIGDISDAGRKDLERWASLNDHNRRVYERLQKPEYLQKEYRRIKAVDPQRAMKEMYASLKKKEERIENREGYPQLSPIGEEKRYHTARTVILTMLSTAAVIALIVGFYRHYNKVEEHVKPKTTIAQVATSKITHGSTQAVLTLDNGDTLHLGGSDEKSLLSKTSNLKPQTSNLQLSTPRGGEFKVTLEDGTEVWLNAETQLNYPETFGDDERRVAVIGEAYFKVAKDAKRPFYVETAEQVVRVYGTQFNVHAYPEDKDVETTLVEGSIALQGGNGSQLMLTPGHQSLFNKESHEASVKAVDTEVVTSWRSGSFVFEDQTLGEIMQTLSRWYDFDYTFADKSLAATEFMGSIPRYGEFSDVVEILEASGGLKIKVKGRNVTIYAK